MVCKDTDMGNLRRISGLRTLCCPVVVLFFALGAGAAVPPTAPAMGISVRDHGAVGDGQALDTAAVQAALDACAAAGGGTVLFPPGTYRCGSVHLRSNVMLWLDHGATILGSKSKDDYDPLEKLNFENDADIETSYFHRSLLWGEGVERVGIAGFGTIDVGFSKRGGPKAIALKRCRFIEIHGIRIINIPNYAVSMLGTDEVNIDGVTILNGYADGIDPDSCRNVRISNCRISTVDDAIVPKASFSLGERRACENITVTNCVLSTVCNAFKLGTESGGGFRRITVSNCVMTGYADNRPALSGIALESVDGGGIEGVAVSNITMVDVRAPVFIRLGNRGRDMDTPAPGTLRDVVISNITAHRASLACSITGIPGHPVRGVTLDNLRMEFTGSNPALPPGAEVPEREDGYPESVMFGPLPAYGLYCRHVEDLAVRDVNMRWRDGFWRLTTDVYKDIKWPGDGTIPSLAEPGDAGAALVCDDVSRLRMEGFDARPDTGGAPVAHFRNVRDALVTGAMPMPGTYTFLEVSGTESRGIMLHGNVFQRDTAPYSAGADVEKTAVSVD